VEVARQVAVAVALVQLAAAVVVPGAAQVELVAWGQMKIQR
jgi:hypothetical protein